MINAKTELLEHLTEVGATLVCACVLRDKYPNKGRLVLREGYNEEELEVFLTQLDYEYDDGYGKQYLFGQLLFTNGSYSIRVESAGSEGWYNLKVPTPQEVEGFDDLSCLSLEYYQQVEALGDWDDEEE